MTRAVDQATWAFEDWERERKTQRYQYWRMLRSARTEFLEVTGSGIEYETWFDGAFRHYLSQKYGLQIGLIDGKITAEYNILDEKKYLLFLMKFSH